MKTLTQFKKITDQDVANIAQAAAVEYGVLGALEGTNPAEGTHALNAPAKETGRIK